LLARKCDASDTGGLLASELLGGNVKAISLFSGAGGMDLGVIQAGFEVLAWN
jgi:hypothetical protein